MVRPGGEVLVDSVVGHVRTASFQHPVVAVVELSTLALVLTVSNISVLLPVDVERNPARHRHLLPPVVGDGEEGVPGVEGQGLCQIVDPPCEVDGGGVLSTGWVVVVPEIPDPLHGVSQTLPGLTLTPWKLFSFRFVSFYQKLSYFAVIQSY